MKGECTEEKCNHDGIDMNEHEPVYQNSWEHEDKKGP